VDEPNSFGLLQRLVISFLMSFKLMLNEVCALCENLF